MRKIVLTFGLISGAILSVLMLLTIPFMEQIGFENGMLVGYSTMVAAFLLVYFGIRSYRDNVAGGQVGFGRAFSVGILITLVSSACYVATWQFIRYKLMPDFMDKYMAWTLDQARAAGATEAAVAQQAKELSEFALMYENPLMNVAITLLEPLPIGLLFTVVSAFLLSRKAREGAAR